MNDPAPNNTRIQKFGPGDRLLGFTTEATAPKAGIGAILWGMGIAQLKVARQLAGLGIPSLQAKLADRDFSKGHYSHDGIALVRSAMDRLARQRDIDSFILMGNCAFANICLNTAITDSRICILALTNPYLTRHQKREVNRRAFARKVFSLNNWMQLLHGTVGIKSSPRVAGRSWKNSTGATVTSKPARPEIGKDMILPDDLDKKLRALGSRGVEIYLGCSATEPGLRYVEKRYRRTLKELRTQGALTLSTIATDVHLLGTNTEGALMHSEAIRQWLSRSARLSVLNSAAP